MNRVRVLIESDYEGEDPFRHRTVAERIFNSGDFVLLDELRAFEDALRGHGFPCSRDSLVVVGEDEYVVKRS